MSLLHCVVDDVLIIEDVYGFLVHLVEPILDEVSDVTQLAADSI